MTLESAWSRIVEGARSDRAAIQAGARSDDDRNALALLEGNGDRTDAEAQGALAALLLGRPRPSRRRRRARRRSRSSSA